MKKKWKGISFVVIFALLAGMLPIGNTQTVQADEVDHGLHNPTTDENGTVTWDCVWFGAYWQNDTNNDSIANKEDDKEPIKWRVLSVDGDDAFLLADQALDVKRYHETGEKETRWTNCDLRVWLNNDFCENAFSEEEMCAVETTTIETADNLKYGTPGGEDTQDKVFLLAVEEVTNPLYGFAESYEEGSKARKQSSTKYAGFGGELIDEKVYNIQAWWLRSSGYPDDYAGSYATFVTGNEGKIDMAGDHLGISFSAEAVRPALHLNLSSLVWYPAGTVKSNGKKSVIPHPSAEKPSDVPTEKPSETQTASPSENPTASPTAVPTDAPVKTPTPTEKPSETQTALPSETQTASPTAVPTDAPVKTPTPTLTPEPSAPPIQKTVPGKVSKLKGKAKKKTIWLSWKKVSDAEGYEVWYSTSKKFKKKSAKTTKAVKLTVKKLKAKKKYYIKVRAYAAENGKKVYGKWSNVIKVKTK